MKYILQLQVQQQSLRPRTLDSAMNAQPEQLGSITWIQQAMKHNMGMKLVI